MPLIPRQLMPTRWYELDIEWRLTWAPEMGADALIDRPVVGTGTKVMHVPAGAGQANIGHEVFLVSEQMADFSAPYYYSFGWLAAIDPAANRDGGITLHLEIALGGEANKDSETVPPSTETPFRISVGGGGEASGTSLTFEGTAFTKARRSSLVSSAVAAIRRLFGRLFPW